MNQCELLEFLRKNKHRGYVLAEIQTEFKIKKRNRNLNKQVNQLERHGFITVTLEDRCYGPMTRKVKTIRYKEEKI